MIKAESVKGTSVKSKENSEKTERIVGTEIKSVKNIDDIKAKADAQRELVLSKYLNALAYINSYVRLPQKYTTGVVTKELSTIANRNKVDFIKVKVFEILLTLSTTNRTNLLFVEGCDNSKCLRRLWDDLTTVYAKDLHTFKVDMKDVI